MERNEGGTCRRKAFKPKEYLLQRGNGIRRLGPIKLLNISDDIWIIMLLRLIWTSTGGNNAVLVFIGMSLRRKKISI